MKIHIKNIRLVYLYYDIFHHTFTIAIKKTFELREDLKNMTELNMFYVYDYVYDHYLLKFQDMQVIFP